MFRALVGLFRFLVDAVRGLFAAILKFLGLSSGSAVSNPNIRNFSVAAVRPDDLLALTFEFQNLTTVQAGGPDVRLVRKDASVDAFLIVRFPPQSIIEEISVEAEDSNSSSGPPLPVGARMSGGSRLVFRVPDNVAEIPFSLDALLDWTLYEPWLAPAGRPGPPFPFGVGPRPRPIASPTIGVGGATRLPPTPVQPDGFTALEIPFRLFLSPNEQGVWAHARAAVVHEGRTELWHTRLGVRGEDAHPEAPGRDDVDELSDHARTLRAIWSLDFPAVRPPSIRRDAFDPAALSATHRHDLVELTANFSRPGCAGRVIQADALMLTSLGAWMNVRYATSRAVDGISLVEWQHRMTFGRDHYVRVVDQGYLFPFGHRAVLITISERKFLRVPGGSATAAYFRQRRFVVVKEPQKGFGATGLTTPDGRSYDRFMPFKSVRITTLTTPNLAGKGAPGEIADDSAFWIQTQTDEDAFQDVPYHLIGTDEAGQSVEFTASLIFVSGTHAYNQKQVDDVATAFKSKANESRRTYSLNGQKVAFAPSVTAGDTTFEASSLTMDVEVPTDAVLPPETLKATDQPKFSPTVSRASVGIPATQRILGKSGLSDITYNESFLRTGFETGNPGKVFADLAGVSPLQFPVDKSGGVATPNFNITCLSRSLGPVGGDVGEAAAASFNPNKVFAGLEARILGAFSLNEILLAAGAGEFPKLITTQTATQITAKLDWQTQKFQAFGPFVPDDTTSLLLHTESLTFLPAGGAVPANPTLHVKGLLLHFTLDLFGCIKVPFHKFAFTADTGKKLDISVELDKITFIGPLSFINTLAELIPPNGLKDGPTIDVSPTGANVGFALGLPTLGGGLFSIQHVQFSAGLTLPFTLAPMRLRFAFSERHAPFMVSIYGITGGGFVGLALGLDGVEQLEASFEVGGSLAISLLVASGAVFIMLGVYFSWEKVSKTEEKVILGGYIRAGGSVEVLGLVSVSIEFYMELAYIVSLPGDGIVHGEASLTVEVEIAFFSKSVSLFIEKDLPAPTP